MNPDNMKLSDTAEFQTLSEYAGEKKEKMADLLNAYTDMGFCSRVWDSKVPEKDKAFYHFFSLKESDNDDILEEVKNYQDFYEEISAVVHDVVCGKSVNCTDLRKKIINLKKKVSQLYQSAKREKRETSSSANYNLHQSFIREYEKLDYMVKDVENKALGEMLTEAQNGWKRALEEIGILKEELGDISHKYNDVCKKLDKLEIEHRKASEKQNVLLAQNDYLKLKLDEITEMLKKQNHK